MSRLVLFEVSAELILGVGISLISRGNVKKKGENCSEVVRVQNPNLTTIADPWYILWKGTCTSKAHKPVTLS